MATRDGLEAKICILGAQGVGKTSLVNRYVSNLRPSSDTPSTVGASFLTKRTEDSETGIPLKLQIWDTAGQERFRSIARLYYRGASAVILVYSITSRASFEELKEWVVEVQSQLGKDTLVHVVGTMSDVIQQDPERREVEMETVISYIAENLLEAKDMSQGMERSVSRRLTPNGLSAATPPVPGAGNQSARHSGLGWEMGLGWDICHEVSAESGEGIEEVFTVLTRKLIDRFVRGHEREALASAEPTGFPDDAHGGSDYFGRLQMAASGSFRLGDTSKRRSWLGLSRNTSFARDESRVDVRGTSQDDVKGRCC